MRAGVGSGPFEEGWAVLVEGGDRSAVDGIEEDDTANGEAVSNAGVESTAFLSRIPVSLVPAGCSAPASFDTPSSG